MSAARSLLVTADDRLLDDVLRLAAAADVEVEVCHQPVVAHRRWAAAPLCLVGADLAAALTRTVVARREGVLVVGLDPDDAQIWSHAVGLGAEHVCFLPDGQHLLLDRLADARDGSPRLAPVVCVAGGRGGAGASTLSAALALTASRRGRRALLVDSDPLGGGIDLVLGSEDVHGLRWPDLAGARGRISATTLHDALPRVESLTVLSWDRGDAHDIPREAMATVLSAARRGSDLVVVDLPRRLDDAAATAAATATTILLVVPAEVRATASAGRVAAALAVTAGDLRVVVRGPAPSALTGEAVASALGLPLAGVLPAEPGLAGALERGEPPGRRSRSPLRRFCDALLDEMLAAPASAA